jgi:hypothetical protein
MQQRYLYGKENDESLFHLKDHVEESKMEQTKVVVHQYEVDKKSDTRWCAYFGEFIDNGECGKAQCKHYNPANGVRGRCQDKHFSYQRTGVKYEVDCGVVTEIKI